MNTLSSILCLTLLAKQRVIPMLLASTLLISSCGDSNKATIDKVDKENTKEIVKKTSPIASLDVSPINLNDIFDTDPPKYAPMSPCPFLTDKTAISTTDSKVYVKAGEESKERKEVSNTYCMWLTGLTVRISPAENASTHKKRVADNQKRFSLKAQDGPGTEATVLYSHSDRYDPVLKGFGFFQDDKYVLIETLMSATSIDRLRRTADEVAKLLPNAPTIKSQTQKRVKKIEVCKIWQDDALKSLFKEDFVSSRIRGSKGCKFKLSSAKEGNYLLSLVIDFNLVKGNNTCDNFEKNKGFSPEKALGNYAVFSKTNESSSRIEHHLAACSDHEMFEISTEAFFSQPDLVDKKALQQKYKKELHQLLENVAGRLIAK